ncbi:MAG: hypothetical protein M1833_003182 [Piccolia ochrophora]|nr:MAG: hypothetical protein M1833_003182 [Piccolia ochrophora]
MRRHLSSSTVSLALGLFASIASSQGVLSAIPDCYQDCITQTGDFTCNGLDIKCLCRLSNGNFLTNIITCIRSNCDNDLDTTQLLNPVAEACKSAGVPIAPKALQNAKSIGSALATTKPLTGATTITSTLASAGTSYEIAVPLSVSSGRNGRKTITGKKSTITQASIEGTDASASASASASETGAAPSSTEASASGSAASSALPAGAAASASAAGSEASASLSAAAATATGDNNGGSPFGNTASAPKTIGYRQWLGMMIGTVLWVVWFS